MDMNNYIAEAKNKIIKANEERLKFPPNYGSYDNLIKEAIFLYEEALAETIDSSEIYFEIGKLRLLLKDKIGACQDFEKAKNLGHHEAVEMINNYCK